MRSTEVATYTRTNTALLTSVLIPKAHRRSRIDMPPDLNPATAAPHRTTCMRCRITPHNNPKRQVSEPVPSSTGRGFLLFRGSDTGSSGHELRNHLKLGRRSTLVPATVRSGPLLAHGRLQDPEQQRDLPIIPTTSPITAQAPVCSKWCVRERRGRTGNRASSGLFYRAPHADAVTM